MMENYVIVPERRIPLAGSFDVAVIGGGMAGIAAAVTAARSGLSTVLIEATGKPGGIPTSGLLGVVSGFRMEDEICVSGILAEIRQLVEDAGGIGRREHIWDPEVLNMVLLDLLAANGVSTWFFTQLIDAVKEQGCVKHAIIASKSGVEALAADLFIDATGDGDLAALAGCPYEKGRPSDGLMQSATLVVKIGGIDRDRAPEATPEITAIWRKHSYDVPIDHAVVSLIDHPNANSEATVNMVHVLNFDATSKEDLTRARFEGTRQAWELLRFFREQVPGFENSYISQTAAQIGVRESRRFIGDYMLTEQDLFDGRDFEDEITRGCWPIDVHNPNGIHHGIGRHLESSYGIPYRCITPLNVRNLYIAGRPISATHEAFSSTRINATCIGIGQAAGSAAGLAIEAGDTRRVDVGTLQRILLDQNVILNHKVVNRIPNISLNKNKEKKNEQSKVQHVSCEK